MRITSYICYRISQFYSIILFIPISIIPFIKHRIFWHPLKLEWYHINTLTQCYDEYMFPKFYQLCIPAILVYCCISCLLLLSHIWFMFILFNIFLIKTFNYNTFKMARFYKIHKHLYKQLDEIHKL